MKINLSSYVTAKFSMILGVGQICVNQAKIFK